MDGLALAYPKRMEEAVPANLRCGVGPEEAPPLRPSVAALVSEHVGRQDAEADLGAGI
jgi:hypothetical protein